MKKIITLLAFLILCTSSAFATDEMQYVEVELFQSGSFSGEYTSETTLYSLDAIYNQINETIKNKNTGSVQLSATCTIEEFKSTYEKVINDHPEYFYAKNGYSYSYSGNNVVAFTPTYYENLLSDTVQQEFDNAKANALSAIDNSMSDLEKALALHDYLVLNIAYNWDVATTGKTNNNNVYSAYGALVEGDAVCQGYSLAYKLLLDACDIGCIAVPSDDMNHMWNAVNIGDSWYHVDTTWDDPTPNLEGSCMYNNFLLSDAGIRGTKHTSWNNIDISISNTDYSGIFNDANTAIHKYNNKYYYFSINQDTGILYEATSLTDTATATDKQVSFFINVVDSRYSPVYSVLWLDDVIYYVDNTETLKAFNFINGNSYELGVIDFEPQANPDFSDKYNAIQDNIGLKLDGNKIITISRTRPNNTFGQFEIIDYPFEWGDDLNKTAIVGTQKLDDNTLQIGFVNTDESINKTLFIALYSSNKMIDIADITPQDMKNGLNILEYNITKEYDEAKIFVLDNNKPVIPCYENIA